MLFSKSDVGRGSAYRVLLPKMVFAVALVILALEISTATGRRISEDQSVIIGTWTDACPCKVPCPCWRTGRSNVARCVNPQVFEIKTGDFKNVDLGGTTFVILNLPAFDFGAPSARVAYVDRNVDPLKVSALQIVIQRSIGNVQLVRSNNVLVKSTRHRQDVNIPGVIAYTIVLPRDNQLSRQVRDHLYPWLSNGKQGIAYQVVYRDGDGVVEYSGTNAMFARFRMK